MSRPMRIAMLAGADKIHTLRWARWYHHAGHQVAVFSDRPAPANRDYGAIPVVQPHWTLWQNFLTYKVRGGALANNRDKWRAYAGVLRAFAPDVLHAHEAIAYGPMLARFPQYPGVLTPWGPDIEALADPAVSPEYRELVLAGARAARLVATNAPGLEDHWARLLGIKRERLRLFSWGVPDAFHPRGADELQRLLLPLGIDPTRQPIHLSPRLARPLYRIDQIIAGWGAATAPGVLVVLRAGAPDEDWRALRGAMAALPTGRDAVAIEHALPPDTMAALYTAATTTLMIPRTDLLAASLLECMACGSIPILAELPCYRAAVVQTPTPGLGVGVYAPPTREGIAAALNAVAGLPPETRAQWQAHNIAEMKQQHWSHRAPEMEQALRDAIDG